MKSDENDLHPVDVYVGMRMRVRRKLLGWSQDKLANVVGVTFQQVQKYEHGTNRVSSSRLYEIAEALGVPVASFFEGYVPATPRTGDAPVAEMPDFSTDFAITMALIGSKIPSGQQTALVRLARSMAVDAT